MKDMNRNVNIYLIRSHERKTKKNNLWRNNDWFKKKLGLRHQFKGVHMF